MNCTVSARIAACACGCAVVFSLAGCGKAKTEPKAGEPAPAEQAAEPQPDPVDALFMQADEMLSNGRTNDAIARIEGALAAPEMKEQRQRVYNGLIRFLLHTEQLAEAKRRMLDAYANDAELARSGLGLVYGYLADRGAQDEIVAWTDQVLALATLPDDIRRSVREWNLMAHLTQGHDEQVLAATKQLIDEAPAADAVALLSRLIDTMFDQPRLALVAQVMEQAGRTLTTDVATKNLLAVTRIRLQTARGEWDALKAGFPAAAASLPDAELQRLLRAVLPAANAAKQTALSDALCEEIIFKQAAKEQAFQTAARQWAENASLSDKSELPVRLEALLRAKLPTRQVCNLFMRYYYDLINDPVLVKPMKELGARLAPLAEDDDTRNSIRTMVLDGSFVLEDYDTALQMLEQRIAGRDDNWHAMAISKVKAHRALQAKQPREAVKYFREFMVSLANAKDEDTSDPATGVIHTKEMILGRNAKRIGDILAAIPDAAAAQLAYAESRDYYAKAKEKAAKSPEALAIVEKETAEIPR